MSMKTANEWNLTNGAQYATHENHLKWIRSIQADALRHAAEGCRSVSTLQSNPSHKNAAMLCAEALENEANKLTKP